jgi:FkbM family methyltransferase
MNPRKACFVLVPTAHGTMIVPRFDYKFLPDKQVELGVGANLLENGAYDPEGLDLMTMVVESCRVKNGDGVVTVDVGANIGAITLSLAQYMEGWGRVLAFEPQERLFYALCGNIVLNNIENAVAYRTAIGRYDSAIDFPVPDYGKASNFGGVNALGTADIGQKFERMVSVQTKRLDVLGMQRLDFIKMDIEGMEIEALTGALQTINRCRPIILVEWIKVGQQVLEDFFATIGYTTARWGMDLICAYGQNEIVERVRNVAERKVA